DLAHEIQESFLPPERDVVNGYPIEAFYQTANEVGGDFYFWEALPDGRTLAGIADVTGKGVAAALDMARGSTMIAAKAPLLATMELGEWVSLLNDGLNETMTHGRFIAGTFVLLDPDKQTITAVAAGQFVPKILTGSPKPEWSDMPAPPQPPMGIAPGYKMQSATTSLEDVTGILVYSDGLLEMQNKSGEFFGDAQFDRSLAKAARGKPSEIMRGLRDTWCTWFYDANYLDDTTALVIHTAERLPNREFRFGCAPENMAGARHFVEAWATHGGYEEKDIGLITLAFDEVVTNIFKHAYDSEPKAIACRVSFEDHDFVIELKHWGKAMIDCPDEVSLPGEDALGGRGLFVIDQVFDSCEYENGPHQTEIVLKKALPG
ncbi:MAG: SpoIIE family protein phosphatase, partial [Verrucomicrobiota bacterium]